MLECECGAELIQDECETVIGVCQESPVVKDYDALVNKPQINGVTLQGNKTTSDLKIDLDIDSAVGAEATLRENADTALGGRIDQEITDRSEAEIALGGRIDGEITNRTNADNALGTRIDNEILARQGGDNNLQSQIDAINSRSDVIDVVATYADLQAYPTTGISDRDVIKVLSDETHSGALTYYRWSSSTSSWTFIGEEAPYYSKSQIDTQMAQKQDKLVAGSNIQIASDGKTISATDTTYTAGTGLTLTGTEFSADTTVLATQTDLTTAIAPKLETEVVSTLPTTGDEGKLYLTPKDYTTGTATGNPITISLGEDAGQITSAQIDGDTYQQTYTGKNLFNKNTATLGKRIGQNGNLYDSADGFASDFISVQSSSDYAVNYNISDYNRRIAFYDSSKTFISRAESVDVTFTTPQNCVYIRTCGEQELLDTAMVVSGSTAGNYEPYVGGVPSPNPDYPQQIQTVTGEQTVSINGTDYPISLGSIELCKLSTYQDYIYKSGDDWKVHKALHYGVYDGSSDENWVAQTGRVELQSIDCALGSQSNNPVRCDHYQTRWGVGTCIFLSGARQAACVLDSTFGANVSSFKTWLASNNIVIIFALATATDTTITDQTLIAQLEAVRTASLQASNTITNTATGSNLAGDLELAYCEFDPHSRYNKWLWLDINNDYEQIGN